MGCDSQMNQAYPKMPELPDTYLTISLRMCCANEVTGQAKNSENLASLGFWPSLT